MVYIIQQCESSQTPITTRRTFIDDRHSTLQAGSCFESVVDGEIVTKSKPSDDKIVIGYTDKGLPFQIVIDGFFLGATQKTHRFINDYVTTLIDDYAKDLEVGDANNVTSNFIDKIYELRTQHAPDAEFTMAIAVTYEKENQLLCSGFGIGDTGIAIKRQSNNQVEQLVFNQEVSYNGDEAPFKDAFDAASSKKINLIQSKNKIFTTPIEPGDELVGYTYLLPDEIEQTHLQYETEALFERRSPEPDTVRKLAIDSSLIDDSKSLYENLIAINNKRHQELLEMAREDTTNTTSFGDDAAFGQIIIPSPELQKKLTKENLAAQRYYGFLKDLQDTQSLITDFQIHQAIESILRQVQALRKEGASFESLSNVLSMTNDLLYTKPEERPSKLEDYQSLINKVQARPSIGWKILGVSMTILGALMITAGILCLVGTLGFGAVAGVGLIVGGGFMASGGLSIGFFTDRKLKNLANSMENLPRQIERKEAVNLYRCQAEREQIEIEPLPLAKADQERFDKYKNSLSLLTEEVKAVLDEPYSMPTPSEIWTQGLSQIYNDMITDAFIAYGIERPEGMEVYFSGSLAQNQATSYSDLDAFVLVKNEADIAQVQQVFAGINHLCNRIYSQTGQLSPDPMGINPASIIGTAETLYADIRDGDVSDPKITTIEILKSKPIFAGPTPLQEEIIKKIKGHSKNEGWGKHEQKVENFCSAREFYRLATKDFPAPSEGDKVNVKSHFLRPINFILMGLATEFNWFHEDKALYSITEIITALRQQDFLSEEDIDAIESVYNQALDLRLKRHIDAGKESDDSSPFKHVSAEELDMLKTVDKFREVALGRQRKLEQVDDEPINYSISL